MNYLSCSAFVIDVALVCVSCICFLNLSVILRLVFDSHELFSFQSPAITFGPHFTFNDSKNDFLPCALPHSISLFIRKRK